MTELFITFGTPLRIFYSIMLGLDGIIYWLVDVVYNVFIVICNTQLFSATTFEAFSTRVYAILGIVMLFVIASQLLMNIADPDKAASGEASTGKLAKNVIISLVAIVLLPTLFKYLYVIQKAVVQENIIGNIIIGGYQNSTSQAPEDIVSNTGKDVAYITFTSFINPAGYTGNNTKGCEAKPLLTYCKLLDTINDYGTSNYGKVSVLSNQQVANEIEGNLVEYRFGLSTLTGALIAYLLLTFSIDMGVRVAKLAYFQLIAPIPIILRIVPKKQDVFDNWVKGLTGTYLGVFIRLMVVYFCIFLINIIPAAWSNIVASGGASDRTIVNVFVSILLIFGVLIFMKEAPKLISQMLGVSDGDMSLGIGKKLAGAAVIGGAVAGAQKLGKKYAGKAYGGLSGALGGGWDAMMNGEGFGAGFRAGGLGGWDAGGRQFGKQRTEMYKSRTGDYKGKPGFFGGKSFGTAYRGEVSDAKKAAIKAASKARIEDAIKSNPAYKKYEMALRKAEFDRIKSDPAAYANWQALSKEAKLEKMDSFSSSAMEGIATKVASGSKEEKDLMLRDFTAFTGGDRNQAESIFNEIASVGNVMVKEQNMSSEVDKRKNEGDWARMLSEGLGKAGGGIPKAPETPKAEPPKK